MKIVMLAACLVGLSGSILAGQAQAAGTGTACAERTAGTLPKRDRGLPAGSAVMEAMLPLSGPARDRAVAAQVLGGNLPNFLRALTPVTLSGASQGAGQVEITICVTPDYLAVGDDRDFVRVPLGLPAAASVADRLGFFLPTTKMVDAIYAQAAVRLDPAPMPPTSAMQSTDYFLRHNRTVEAQRLRAGGQIPLLIAGQKKDIVLTNRLLSKPGRVAIYGWHRPNGKPIQPLSTVHDAHYADYSHGVRLVAPVAFVNGAPRALSDILADPQLASIVSSEGAIATADRLQRSLY